MRSDLFFLKPLLLTLFFELTLAWIVGLRNKDLLLVALVNLVSNPLLSLSFLLMSRFLSLKQCYLFVYLLLEPLIISGEAGFFHAFLKEKRNALQLSFLLNCGSILGGLLWNCLF